MQHLLNHGRPRLRGARWFSLGVAVLLLAAAAAEAEPRLTVVVGAVQVGRGDPPRWEAASEGSVLGAGDSVRTGRGARAEIDLGGATARLFESSLLRLPPDHSNSAAAGSVELGRGDALFDVRKRTDGDPFEVRTPEVVASVKGTRFAVQLGVAAASVSVFSGAVGVRAPGADLASEMLVRPGFAAVGSARASFELSPATGLDPWGGWQQNATPPASPGLPSSDTDAGAPAALAEAKQAALRASGPEVIGVVVAHGAGERTAEAGEDSDGAKRGKSHGARADASANGDGTAPVVDPAGLAGSAGRAAAGGATSGSGTAPPLAVDPVSVADRSGLARGVREQIAETVLNGGVPAANGAPGGSAIALSLELLTRNGPNRIAVTGPAGQLALITRGDVESILATGDPGKFGPGLLSALAANGVDPMVFAQRVESLLH